MPTIVVISRHSPENCFLFNEKAKKVRMKFLSKADGLSKKHGIKVLGSGTVIKEHIAVVVYEAASLEAYEKYSMEPEVLALSAYETVEAKTAVGREEVAKMLRQVK